MSNATAFLILTPQLAALTILAAGMILVSAMSTKYSETPIAKVALLFSTVAA